MLPHFTEAIKGLHPLSPAPNPERVGGRARICVTQIPVWDKGLGAPMRLERGSFLSASPKLPSWDERKPH